MQKYSPNSRNGGRARENLTHWKTGVAGAALA